MCFSSLRSVLLVADRDASSSGRPVGHGLSYTSLGHCQLTAAYSISCPDTAMQEVRPENILRLKYSPQCDPVTTRSIPVPEGVGQWTSGTMTGSGTLPQRMCLGERPPKTLGLSADANGVLE